MHKLPYHLLGARRFLPLFVTQFLEAFNDMFLKSAVFILIAYQLVTHASNAQIYTALGQGLFILPFFLFSGIAGQLSDKFDKSLLTRIIKSVEILAMFIAAIGFYTSNMTLLLVAILLMGIHSTFFGPIKYAILPDLLAKNELVGGNALIVGSTFLGMLFGTIMGGGLLHWHTGTDFVAILGIVFAVTGLIAAFYMPSVPSNQPKLELTYNIFKQSWQMIRETKRNREVFIAIMAISWFWLVGIALLIIFPALSTSLLHANSNVATLLLASFAIGFSLGSVLCERLQKGSINAKYVPVGIFLMTFFLVDLSIAVRENVVAQGNMLTVYQFFDSFDHVRILIDLFLLAVAGGLYTVPLYAMVQALAKKTERSRTLATLNIIAALFMVAASVLIGLFSYMGISIPSIILLLAIVNIFVAFVLCKLLPEAVVKSVICWLLKLLYRVEVKGIENYHKASKKAIIIANHISLLDGLLISAFMPDKMMFVINSYVAKIGWIKPFLSLVDAYPLDTTNPMFTKGLIKAIKQNKHCIIFPEGRITVTGGLMKIYEGPGMIADKAKADLLPIRIDGAQYTPFSRLKGKVRLRLFPKITLHILPARRFDIDEKIKGRERRALLGSKLFDLMRELMFDGSNFRQTLFQSLIEAKTIHGRNHVIVEDFTRRSIKYQSLLAKSFVLGQFIAKRTKKGEYVGIMLPNSIGAVVTFYAMQAVGRVPTLINFSLGPNNIKLTSEIAKVKTIFCAQAFIDKSNLHESVELLSGAGIKVVLLDKINDAITPWMKLSGVLMSYFPLSAYRVSHKNADPKKPAVVLFTSGSEGVPKGVVLSHINLQSNRLQMSSGIDISSNDTIFNALPMFHSFGLMAGTLLGTLSGIKVFMYPSPLHYRIIPELVYDTNATILFGTNTFLNGYARSAHVYDFYSVRYVFAGAEKLQENTTSLWMEKFGVRIFQGYGATEASPVLTCNTPMQHKRDTVGRFVPRVAYQLKRVKGIAEGGRLVVSGPNVMLGYLLADTPGKLVKADIWYDTGDIVSIDEFGYVTIVGRVKRFAKISGEMVSLSAVEVYINKLWPDYQHALLSVPDDKKGEKLVLITDNPKATKEAISAYYKKQGIGLIQRPSDIHIVKEIPLMGTGKVDYVTLKAQFSGD